MEENCPHMLLTDFSSNRFFVVLSYGYHFQTVSPKYLVFVPKIFHGNYDRYMTVTHKLRRAVFGRYFRIHPVTWRSWICLRVEFYGRVTGLSYVCPNLQRKDICYELLCVLIRQCSRLPPMMRNAKSQCSCSLTPRKYVFDITPIGQRS